MAKGCVVTIIGSYYSCKKEETDMAKELTVRGHFKTENGEYKDWDSFTPEEQKQIGLKMNDRMLRAIGYVPVNELSKGTA